MKCVLNEGIWERVLAARRVSRLRYALNIDVIRDFQRQCTLRSRYQPYRDTIYTDISSMSNIQNRVIVVTGCSSGIGLATARLFLERQAIVFGIDVGAVPQKLADTHSTFTFHQADLTSDQAVEHAIAKCIGKHNRIDVLVNCAGVSDGWSSADTIQDEEWERVISINLTVPIRMMRAVLPAMKEQKGGSIINVASKAGISGASAGIAYTSSKHGLVRISPRNADGRPRPAHRTALSYKHDRLEPPRMSHGDSTPTISAAMQCFQVVCILTHFNVSDIPLTM